MLTINQCYLDFVNKILKEGKETYKDSNHHLVESLGNFYIIDDPFDLKFRAKYQHYTTEMLLADIKAGKFDMGPIQYNETKDFNCNRIKQSSCCYN